MNKIAEGPERAQMLELGDRLYDLIPMEEKLRHKGERIAIDLRTGEYRFFPYHVRGQELAVTGPTWTSVVRVSEEVHPATRFDH